MSFQNCSIKGVRVNSDVYHTQTAKRGSLEFVMSPSSLRSFSGCPSRWIAGYESPDSEAKDFGNLLDCLVLTPEQFDLRYAVKPQTYKDAKTGEEKPWNGNSGVCKAWLEEHSTLEVVSKNDLSDAQAACKRLLADETIAAFLKSSERQVHVVGEWHDPATKMIIPVQCLIDCVPDVKGEFQKSLGDLKTTRNAAQHPFSRWCYTAGYHVQAAFDLALYTAATGEDRTDWIFLLAENYAPWETGRRLLSQDFLEIGKQTYQHILAQYARGLKTGQWDSYDPPEEFSLVAPEPWMEFEAISSAMEATQTQLETSDEIGITP